MRKRGFQPSDDLLPVSVRPGIRPAKQLKDAGRSLWWCQRRARGRRDAPRRADQPGVRGLGIGHLALQLRPEADVLALVADAGLDRAQHSLGDAHVLALLQLGLVLPELLLVGLELLGGELLRIRA